MVVASPLMYWFLRIKDSLISNPILKLHDKNIRYSYTWTISSPGGHIYQTQTRTPNLPCGITHSYLRRLYII